MIKVCVVVTGKYLILISYLHRTDRYWSDMRYQHVGVGDTRCCPAMIPVVKVVNQLWLVAT